MTSPNTPPCDGLLDLFFATAYEDQARAKELCQTCLLQAPCLDYALRTTGNDPYVYGVMGGYDARERGFYKKLFPGRVTAVQVLPPRYRTKDPAAKKAARRGAAA